MGARDIRRGRRKCDSSEIELEIVAMINDHFARWYKHCRHTYEEFRVNQKPGLHERIELTYQDESPNI